MTSGFKNSAGTDLDSLFLVNNQNAGAIGFKISDGTDLGNRYSNATTKLNQTIGFKNSAGTDIGYLRSKVAPGPPTYSGKMTVSAYGGSVTINGVTLEYAIYGVLTTKKVNNLKIGSYAFTYGTYANGYYAYTNDYLIPDGTYTVSFTM
jgi:hypothetical protein